MRTHDPLQTITIRRPKGSNASENGHSPEVRAPIGSPTRARTWELQRCPVDADSQRAY